MALRITVASCAEFRCLVNVPGSDDGEATAVTNADDVDGDNLIYVVEQLPLHGELALNADGTFDYQPDANYDGSDLFMYRAFDGTARSETATVSLDLQPVNDVPTATGGAFLILDNAAVGTIVGSISAIETFDTVTVEGANRRK